MIADWYKQHGYQFLALTEHNVIAEAEVWVDAEANATRSAAVEKYIQRFGNRWAEFRTGSEKKEVRLKPLAEFRSLLEESGKFLLIPAEEISHSYAKRPIHMNGINLRDTIKPLDGKDAIETIAVNLRQIGEQRRKTARMMIGFLNHPNYGWGVRAEEMLLVEELRFFEVFNGHPSVRNYGDDLHASCERVWDIALALRLGKHGLPIVYGMATDDAHGYHAYGVGKVNPGRGWVMIKSPHLTAEGLIHGLETGEFYATSGVLFDEIKREGDELRLAIRTEAGVGYKTQFFATLKGTSLDAKPKLDKDGRELPVTADYSPDIGKGRGGIHICNASIQVHRERSICPRHGDLDQATPKPLCEGGCGSCLDATCGAVRVPQRKLQREWNGRKKAQIKMEEKRVLMQGTGYGVKVHELSVSILFCTSCSSSIFFLCIVCFFAAILLCFSPSFAAKSNRFGTAFSGSDSDAIVEREDEDLPIADSAFWAGSSRSDDGVNRWLDEIFVNSDLKLHFPEHVDS